MPGPQVAPVRFRRFWLGLWPGGMDHDPLGREESRAMTDVRCVGELRCILGETPVWSVAEGALYWIDIEGRRLYRRDEGAAAETFWDLPARVGCVTPRTGGG